ncbi:ATPase (plasmid) [Trichormus variabilis NIES-23]|uniref:ATPase n=1 Tax=Trichormus variabilis NIES-23 TaxID=1973479 RepID=A0A1Z4KX22_ANAVA|nr:ATPase [Trichormus variabilis NIES-23]
MDNFLTGNQNSEMQIKLTQFKEYAVLHPQLARVDMLLMRAIREPAGFAHVNDAK